MNFKNFIDTDTFTIVARCERTGMLGVGLTTREIAVTSRCPHVKARVGAVSTQARTDPRLGHLAIKLLELGYSASKVVEELKASDPYIEHRQIGVVDRDGNSAAYTGSDNRDWAGHISQKNYIAMGNALTSEEVVRAMAEAFEASAGETLEERLMRVIEAGRDAGGQHGGQHSAGILIYDREIFPRVDLRVEHHDEPVGELRRILEIYKPLVPYYAQRPSDPTIGSFDEWLLRQKSKKG